MSENPNNQINRSTDDVRDMIIAFEDAITNFERNTRSLDLNVDTNSLSDEQENCKGRRFKLHEILSEDTDWVIQDVFCICGILEYMKNFPQHSIRISSPSGSGKTFLFGLLNKLSLPGF